MNARYVFQRLYPTNSFLTKEGRTAVESILTSFIKDEEIHLHKMNGPILPLNGESKASVKISCDSKPPVSVEVGNDLSFHPLLKLYTFEPPLTKTKRETQLQIAKISDYKLTQIC